MKSATSYISKTLLYIRDMIYAVKTFHYSYFTGDGFAIRL